MQLNHPKGFFITGTDTNAGKTTATKILMTEFLRKGYSILGCKPVACCEHANDICHDGLSFLELNSVNLPLSIINPMRLNFPVSPNIAAKSMGKTITVGEIFSQLKALYDLPLDFIFFEGVGGWKVPLNDTETMADLAKQLQVPVILVVGIRVGCLNHALLTYDALRQDGLPLLGWIANVIDAKTPLIEEHIETLQNWLPIPHLGIIPHHKDPLDQHWHIDIEPFLQTKQPEKV